MESTGVMCSAYAPVPCARQYLTLSTVPLRRASTSYTPLSLASRRRASTKGRQPLAISCSLTDLGVIDNLKELKSTVVDTWKEEYQKSAKNLKGDLFGGFTAAVVALPLALAFGVASGETHLASISKVQRGMYVL